mgnify:CR=1 FL=1
MIHEALRRHAREIPKKAAVICGDSEINYRELDSLSNKLAYSLGAMGIQRQEKVSFLMKNTVEFPLLYYALIKLGAIGIPLNTRYSGTELEFVVNHAETQTLIYDDTFSEVVEQIRPKLHCITRLIAHGSPEEDTFKLLLEHGKDVAHETNTDHRDEMIYFYTSGTTDDPKGVVLSHNNCISSSDMWIRGLGLTGTDRVFVTTPLWHCSATTAFMLSAGRLGSTLILLPDYETEEILRVIQNQKVTLAWLVPSIMVLMQENPKFEIYDLSSLEKVLCGGAPLGIDVIKKWKQVLTGLKIFNGYAQTEGATAGTLLTDESILTKPNSIGKPLSEMIKIKVVADNGREVAMEHIGEILIKGPNIMKGYFKNPTLTSQTLRQGWLHTGDLGYLDDEDFLYYAGRKKDLIIRGGENIFPEEIEDVLSKHPYLLESSVIGISDKIFGEVVMALVVPRKDKTVTAFELIEHCRKHLADYKVPKYIELVQELPKNPTGKILKKILRKQYEDFK